MGKQKHDPGAKKRKINEERLRKSGWVPKKVTRARSKQRTNARERRIDDFEYYGPS